ncbi:hypothetical protein CVT26_009422, partial [Gymnopilus dilepis]
PPQQGGYYPQQPQQAYQQGGYGGYPQQGYQPQPQPQTVYVQQPAEKGGSGGCMACLAGIHLDPALSLRVTYSLRFLSL